MSDRPLRILHLTLNSDQGGITRYIHDLAVASVSRGVESVVAAEPGNWHALFDDPAIRFIPVKMGGSPWTLTRACDKLVRELADEPVDLVHAHYRKASLLGRMLAKRLNLPLLYTLHLTDLPMWGPWKWLTDFGDHTHAVSEQGRTWLRSVGVADEQITVIAHAVDRRRFARADEDARTRAREALGLPLDAAVGVFVGRFEKQKNPWWMVDLARALRSRPGDQRLVMMGGGPDFHKIQRQIQQEHLGEVLQLVPHGDPLPVYRAADVFLLPSQIEGFGLVAIEAMSVGRPVLRTATAGWQEQIVDGQTGWVTPIDHRAWVEKASQVMLDRDRLRSMSDAAAAHLDAQSTYDDRVDETLALYRRLIADHTARVRLRHRSPWSRRDQIRRVAWMVAQATLFRFSLHNAYRWRAWLLRRFGARIGTMVRIRPTVRIEIPWNLTIDDHAAVGDFAILYCLGPIHIGAYATISQYGHLCAGTHDFNDPDMPLLRPPIRVGDHAWVAADAFVGPGVTVGDYAVVGARAGVYKDVSPHAIVGGNPAKVLGQRKMKGPIRPDADAAP